LPGVLVLASDGHVTYTGLPVQPAGASGPNSLVFSSPGQGVWATTGDRAFTFEMDINQADELGDNVGTLTLRGSGQVSPDGQSIDSTGNAAIADPAGNVLATLPFSARGSRMAVSPAGLSNVPLPHP
jgi:hypothetical protein